MLLIGWLDEPKANGVTKQGYFNIGINDEGIGLFVKEIKKVF